MKMTLTEFAMGPESMSYLQLVNLFTTMLTKVRMTQRDTKAQQTHCDTHCIVIKLQNHGGERYIVHSTKHHADSAVETPSSRSETSNSTLQLSHAFRR